MTRGVLRCEMPQPSPPSASADPRSSRRLASAMVIWKYKVMAPEPKPTSSSQADGHGMVERRHQADRSRHAGPAQHRPQSLRSRAYEARSDQPGGYRAESAQREQDAGGPLAVAEVCEQQGVERDGKRKRQRREVGAKHRILDDPLMEQAPVADQQVRAADGRLLRGRLGAETGKKGHQPSACQGEECGLESRCGEEKSTKRSAGDLAYVG